MEAARIALPNGNTLEVKASGVSDKNRYVKKVLLRGKEYDKMYITHGDLLAGGTLEFVMSSKPNKSRGRKASEKPYSMTGKVR
jgi:putative alpha-1,2-mannosidase